MCTLGGPPQGSCLCLALDRSCFILSERSECLQNLPWHPCHASDCIRLSTCVPVREFSYLLHILYSFTQLLPCTRQGKTLSQGQSLCLRVRLHNSARVQISVAPTCLSLQQVTDLLLSTRFSKKHSMEWHDKRVSLMYLGPSDTIMLQKPTLRP